MKQAMVFAAGLGTRLKPLTDTMPKALVPVGEKPLLWHVLTKLREAGFERVVVNVHHFAQQIVDYLKQHDFGMDVRISDESTQLLETGGGIKKARVLFDPTSPVLIHNVDILSNADLARLYEMATGDALLLVSPRNTKRYLLFDEDSRLQGWTNIETGELRGPVKSLIPNPGEPTPNAQTPSLDHYRKSAFSGIHVFSPSLFPLMDAWPERFGIIDFYLATCADHRIMGYEKGDLRLMDVGKIETLDQAERFISKL